MTASSKGRLPGVDLARSAALAGMVVFHLARDLEIFGVLAPGTTLAGGWALFARLIAGSFLFLAGVSLVLAHGRGLRLRAFARRIAVVAAAAALVSLASWIGMPGSFIYFGILHAIVAASVIGILFVPLPAVVTALAAVAVWALGATFGRALDLPVWLVWTGLAARVPPTLDFIPVLPWLGPCLLGIAAAKVLYPRLDRARSPAPQGKLVRWLAWPGRHSLAVYLVHQPVLLGGLALAAWLGLI